MSLLNRTPKHASLAEDCRTADRERTAAHARQVLTGPRSSLNPPVPTPVPHPAAIWPEL